jgi:Ca2+/Na+ antiporter
MHLQPELESKRIEKAQARKFLYVLLAMSSVVWALLILNRLHPSPSVRLILLASLVPYGYLFYRLAGWVRKIKSILPAEMELKRVAIAKSHNRFLLTLISAVGAGLMLVLVLIGPHQKFIIWIAILITPLTLGWGVYYVIQRDNELCRKLGYICPFCNKPLYEPHANTYLTGLCPKCKTNILPDRPSITLQL